MLTMDLRKAGREEREAAVREALEVAAQHQRRGRLDEALELYRRVFEIDPENFDAAVGVGNVLMAAGRIGDAIMAYGGALAARPEGSFDLFLNRGTALAQANDPEAASASFRRAVALEPDNVHALNNLGGTYAQLGRLDEALEQFRRAQELKPDHAPSYFNAALALAKKDAAANEAEIVALYRKAIECDPKFVPACINLAEILVRRGEAAEALQIVEQAEFHAPRDLPVLLTKGRIYEALGEQGNATAVFERAVLLHPNEIDAKLALARAALAAGKVQKAVSHCFELLAARPELSPAKLLLGNALLEDGKAARARQTLEEVAEELPPAQELLRRLDWAEGREDGWAAAAARALARPAAEPLPTWDGAATDAVVLVDARGSDPEDVLQLVRLLPEAAGRCGGLVLRCDPIAGPLFDSLAGVRTVLQGNVPPPADVGLRLPIEALPKALGRSGADLPAEVPYLHPAADRARNWDPATFVANEPVVGLCWRERGRPVGPDQDLTFRELEPLLEGIPARFLSFTYRNGRNDAALMEDYGIPDIAAACRDLDDVAAALAQVDLVITCDGLIPHLAGAIGRECWLLLPVFPQWRWGRRGLTCPFYPTVRTFRAERTGDWASVLADVRAELAERTG